MCFCMQEKAFDLRRELVLVVAKKRKMMAYCRIFLEALNAIRLINAATSNLEPPECIGKIVKKALVLRENNRLGAGIMFTQP